MMSDKWPDHRIPRKITAAAPHGVSMKSSGLPRKQTPSIIKQTRAKAKPKNCQIRRDSRKQLNISGGGEVYEKAKSRRVRQKTALEQSGNQNAAVALGKRKSGSVVRSVEVDDLERENEHKSFVRRVKITHELKRQQEVQRQEKEKTLNKIRRTKHQRRQVMKQKAISDFPKRSALTTETHPVVIDLINDDERDTDENDVILTLTQLLQDEAIGRGANRKEMKVYAQNLFQVGLHSREMILDALDFNSNDLADGSTINTSLTSTDMASDIVNRWEWMKPFHKSMFYRWVWSQHQQQQQQQRR